MRFLLISDTHGNLSSLNNLVRNTGAQAIIHAGDFGFYDLDSTERLSERELLLRVLHSGLSDGVKVSAKTMKPKELVNLVRRELPVSEFPEYLAGTRRFAVPVYTIWGNHEDRTVVEAVRDGHYKVPNLFLLDERQRYRVGRFHLFGLGGNLILGPKLFHKPLAGASGKMWTTLIQIGQLIETVDQADAGGSSGEVRVFVTHLSPGRERVVALLATYLCPHFHISGHMGTPYCSVWSEFTIREWKDTVRWLDSVRPTLEEEWEKHQGDLCDAEGHRLAERAMQALSCLSRATSSPEAVPPGFRRTFYVNLPDGAVGHAVLTDNGTYVSLETKSLGQGFRIP